MKRPLNYAIHFFESDCLIPIRRLSGVFQRSFDRERGRFGEMPKSSKMLSFHNGRSKCSAQKIIQSQSSI